jgi:hypothetical protein
LKDRLSVSLENCRVSPLPVGAHGRSVLGVLLAATHQASVFAACRRLATALSVFLRWIADPVDASIALNRLVEWIDQNDLEISK